jgi:hypothetical protein
MFWLNDDDNDNDNKQIEFYQLFIKNDIVYDDKEGNTIYSFEENNINLNINDKLNLTNYKYTNIICEIKIIDHIIAYTLISNNKNYVFSTKMNFINPNESDLNIPIFNYTYKQINKNRLPNLIESQYNLSTTLEFKIYNLNQNVQFIIETNPITNSIKQYFITKNLNSIKNFL